MATNPVVGMEQKQETEMETVPEKYMDIISGEFAYDPVRLPPKHDPTQLLYNRNTLQIIWEIEQHARNPITRQWFDIKSAIPQTELRKEMNHFIKLHGLPSNTVIANYSKILDDGQMNRCLMTLNRSVAGKRITEKEWEKIWKKVNIVRLFCEFHSQNINTFMSVHGFRYFRKLIAKILREKESKEAALNAGKEVVRAIDVIINGVSSGRENSKGILGYLRERKGDVLISSLMSILAHVYNNNEGYMKIHSYILRVFSKVFDEFAMKANILVANPSPAVMLAYPCALRILSRANAVDISSEDLNHGISILRRPRVSLLYFKRMYCKALYNVLIICISREIDQRSKEMSGLKDGQLVEAQVQAQHNSEALEWGVRLLRDILMKESQLAACILGRGLDILKELVHMFERLSETVNEDEDETGYGKFGGPICVNDCEMVDCVHYRIAKDGLVISEAISRRQVISLDVEVLRKFGGGGTCK